MKLEIERSNSAQVDLKIPVVIQHQGWEYSQQHYTAANQWQGYLNYLCHSVSIPWLSTSLTGCDLEWERDRDTTSIWELVEGSIVTVGKSRICLLPHTSCDRSELRVPQEWVEIPNWIADYYLAVQIDLDNERATIWGFTTHLKLQQRGLYDDLDRMYCLDADELIQDFSILQLTEQLSVPPATRGMVDPIEHLTHAQVDRYMADWSHKSLAVPRLELREAEFPHWLSLLSNDNWRQQLTAHRLGLVEPVVAQE